MTITVLDTNIKTLLNYLGHSSLYPPQELALSKGMLEGKNLLVTTPTASGKTLIAIMAAIKTIEKGLKIVYLTPLRALATEKYHDFLILESLNIIDRKIRVRLASGDYNSSGNEIADADVIVLTNEKMDSLIRHSTQWLSNVGLFVADEVHIIGERDRGPTLEMMLTKIRKFYPLSQILALSATVANSVDIARWLDCELIKSDWRPTKLVEGVYEHGNIRMNNGDQFKIQTSSGTSSAVIDIAIDSLDNCGGQVIIFAETRKRASSLAAKAADGIYKRLDERARETAEIASLQISNKGDDTDITRNLCKVISKGVAFHHAGLGPSSREIVEESFKKGVIKLLIATPTLASGVNLPARRVILASTLRYDSEYGGNVPISVLEYKQLCGRAGRPKYDNQGEAIIMSEAYTNADEIYEHYIAGDVEPLRSQLTNDRAIRVHILSTIATIPGAKKDEIYDLFENTLFAQQYRKATVNFKVDSALSYLENEDLIKSKNGRYIATQFGRYISLLYIDPLTGVEFRRAVESIERARVERKNTNDHLILFLYLITNSPDFYPKISLRKKDFEEVSCIIQEHQEQLQNRYDPFDQVNEYTCSRSLWALYEWINETSDRVLSDKIGIEPGDMYRLVENASWLSYSLYEIAKLLKREDLLIEIFNLKTRIKYGVKEELLSLIALEGIGRSRARALYNAGLTDTFRVAEASESKISEIPKIGSSLAKKLKEQLRRKAYNVNITHNREQ